MEAEKMSSKEKQSSGPDTFKIHSSAGADQVLSSQELIDHIDFVHQLTSTKTADDLAKQLLKLLDRFGFSDFIFFRQTSGQPPDFFFTSVPQELISQYLEQNLYRRDMVLDYLKTANPEHLHLSAVKHVIEKSPIETLTFSQNLKMLDLYREFCFHDAYLIPIRLTKKEKPELRKNLLFAVLCKNVTGKEFLQLTKDRGPALHALGDAVARIYDLRFPQVKKEEPSGKPIELLNTMAKSDLKLSQAADKHCISIHTANKRIALAKKMLGTSSLANAIYLAYKRNLLD